MSTLRCMAVHVPHVEERFQGRLVTMATQLKALVIGANGRNIKRMCAMRDASVYDVVYVHMEPSATAHFPGWHDVFVGVQGGTIEDNICETDALYAEVAAAFERNVYLLQQRAAFRDCAVTVLYDGRGRFGVYGCPAWSSDESESTDFDESDDSSFTLKFGSFDPEEFVTALLDE